MSPRSITALSGLFSILLVMGSGIVGCGIFKEGFNLFVDDTKLEVDTQKKKSSPPEQVDFDKVY